MRSLENSMLGRIFRGSNKKMDELHNEELCKCTVH
jgi:hypothetical protein